jgi:hypothetical protein
VGCQLLIAELLKLLETEDDGHPYFGGFGFPPIQLPPFFNCETCLICFVSKYCASIEGILSNFCGSIWDDD